MKVGARTILLLTFLVSSYIAGLLIFTKGFLLVRSTIHKNSSCQVDFASEADHYHGGYQGCWMHARFKRAVIIIIDALKYDFMVYNHTLGKDAPPYKNKLVSLHALMNRKPKNTKLFKFMADPPTTTLQRLKGLTTGSLPTFVDAGSNFDSSEITEDNVIDQLISNGKNIKFLGDDTWENLFPNRFFRSFPFPSFNVKDLHTVDNGILKHLYPELRKRDWDVLIAHFLGVDHCGHRYGPNHRAMADKLSQMDYMIRNVTQLLRDDTILFVFGDHGMTRTGDHGGDSEDELSAGLFVYSPAQITASSPAQDADPVVQQTDLVPTLALLMGIPVPFSNLGSIIPDLFNHCPWWDTEENTIRQVFHTVEALHLNALQVSNYISTYAASSSDFPADKFHLLNNLLQRAETELQVLVTKASSGGGSHDLRDRFKDLEAQYQRYLSEVRKMCQDVWAKFDLVSIVLGVTTVLTAILLNLVYILCWSGEEEELPGYLPFVMGGLILQIVYYVIHLLIFPSTVPPVMAFVLGLVLLFTLSVVLKRKLCEVLTKINWRDAVDAILAVAAVVLYSAAFFSNSFVVFEDTVTHFLAQSLLWLICFRVIWNLAVTVDAKIKETVGRASKKSKHSSLFDIVEWLTQPAVMTFVITAMCSGLLRLSATFRACREEQWTCEPSSLLQPLSAFAEGASGYRNQRYFFNAVILLLTLWLVRRWMQYYGSLNGDSVNVLCAKYVVPVGGIACCLYWAIQALPEKDLDALPVWQQTVMAQVVYICAAVYLLVITVQPVFVYIWYPPSANTLSLRKPSQGAQNTIPYVYKQLQEQWHKRETDDSPPAAYGLGSVYSSSIVALATSLFLVLVLLLGDGMSSSLSLVILMLFLFLELVSAYSYGQGAGKEPVPWITVVTHGLLSSVFFYATGHQATIPSIRFESAFTGFHGDFSTNILPGFLIALNTFAAPVFFTVVFPLLLFWPFLEGPVSKLMVMGQREGSSQWKGDFRLFDDGVLLRKNVFISFCRLLLFHAVKVLGAACAAGLHRRHLMVWKIFAPRFIFEAVTMIIVSIMSVLMVLFVLRVDHAVFKLTRSLESKSKNS